MGLGALSSAMSGMRGAQRRLDLASHNISNAQTPGYQRQVVEQRASGSSSTSGVFSGSVIAPGGSIQLGISRVTDEGLTNRLIQSAGEGATLTATADQLKRLEAVFPEPHENALGSQFAQFWAAWQGVSNQPSSSAARTALLAQADALTSSLHKAANDVTDLSYDASSRLNLMVTEVNDLTRELAGVSSSILAGDPNLSATQDLLSRRDYLAAQLAEKTGGRVNVMAEGTFQFLLGGRPLVDGANASELQYSAGNVVWALDGTNASLGGTMLGLQTFVNATVPQYQGLLDGIAAALVADVNALHSTGYDQAGNTGVDFFDPANVTAQTISLDVAVDGNPQAIAAGAVAAPEDGDIARQIASLAMLSSGADAQYRDLIATLGVETRLAAGRASAQGSVTASLELSLNETTGVNIDEQTIEIMAAQRAFQAAARIITAVDEMLATLIERTGVVGR
jgi:flagellar hook-associated protein 1 FlgK